MIQNEKILLKLMIQNETISHTLGLKSLI
jgi:hypothetical protein